MTLEYQNDNRFEHNDELETAPTVEQQELSQEEYNEWLQNQQASFEQETNDEIAGANKYTNLDDASLEKVKEQTGVQSRFAGLYDKMHSVINTARGEAGGNTDLENQEKKRSIMEHFGGERGEMLKGLLTSEVTSNGLDMVPFVGGGKMLTESIWGSKLTGEKLSGKERIIHGAMGAGILALDFTGAGELLSLTGKSPELVQKIGSKLAEKGMASGAKIFEKSAAFMAEHPDLTRKAEEYAQAKIKGLFGNLKNRFT